MWGGEGPILSYQSHRWKFELKFPPKNLQGHPSIPPTAQPYGVKSSKSENRDFDYSYSFFTDKMADADEDGMLRASSSTDPSANIDHDISDETQDFRFLSNIAL